MEASISSVDMWRVLQKMYFFPRSLWTTAPQLEDQFSSDRAAVSGVTLFLDGHRSTVAILKDHFECKNMKQLPV